MKRRPDCYMIIENSPQREKCKSLDKNHIGKWAVFIGKIADLFNYLKLVKESIRKFVGTIPWISAISLG